jgi:hypothetical protein
MLTGAYKGTGEETTVDLYIVQEIRAFCPKLPRGHEIEVQCSELKFKQQLMEWCHMTFPTEKEFKSALSA